MSRKFGLKSVGDDEDWTIFWTDTSVLLERVMDMKRYQVSLTRLMDDPYELILLHVRKSTISLE